MAIDDAAGVDRAAVETLHEQVLGWYDHHARDLPWRAPGVSPWAVLVSEVMLQQTPVERVRPAYHAWLERWPTAAALAADSPGEAVRQWGRLGYPRRALRLHAAAASIVMVHGGAVPSAYEDLRALPGVGDYTAAAVASFAFGRRHAVLDTNVRRVLARAVLGRPQPSRSIGVTERRVAETLLPEAAQAPRWAVAVMELGALVCRSAAPDCAHCPVADGCAWRLAGRPMGASPARPSQRYEGTDRQARGALLAVLRAAPDAVDAESLRQAWSADTQRTRALRSLVTDGLVEVDDDGRFALPGATGRGGRA